MNQPGIRVDLGILEMNSDLKNVYEEGIYCDITYLFIMLKKNK